MSRLTHYQKDGEVAEPYNRVEAYDFAKKLAEYEDLEEQGSLVRLPCKVGNTVYIITTISKSIITAKVIGIWACEDGDAVLTESGGIHQNSWGKTVFLTREEAEAALKESEGEECESG